MKASDEVKQVKRSETGQTAEREAEVKKTETPDLSLRLEVETLEERVAPYGAWSRF